MSETTPLQPPQQSESAKRYILSYLDESTIADTDLYALTPAELDNTVSYPFELDLTELGYPVGTKEILVADIVDRDEVAGFGEIFFGKFDEDRDTENRAYVAYTFTKEQFRKQGLGKRRYELMNRLAVEQFGSVLYSDPAGETASDASRVWQGLVKEGKAEICGEVGGTPVFRFVS